MPGLEGLRVDPGGRAWPSGNRPMESPSAQRLEQRLQRGLPASRAGPARYVDDVEHGREREPLAEEAFSVQ